MLLLRYEVLLTLAYNTSLRFQISPRGQPAWYRTAESLAFSVSGVANIPLPLKGRHNLPTFWGMIETICHSIWARGPYSTYMRLFIQESHRSRLAVSQRIRLLRLCVHLHNAARHVVCCDWVMYILSYLELRTWSSEIPDAAVRTSTSSRALTKIMSITDLPFCVWPTQGLLSPQP
jgi:hypothetical protein